MCEYINLKTLPFLNKFGSGGGGRYGTPGILILFISSLVLCFIGGFEADLDGTPFFLFFFTSPSSIMT